VGEQGAILSLIGTVTHGEPGSTLRSFNVLTNSWAVGPRLIYPVKRTRAESAVIEAGITVQTARVSILGAPFSHDDWRVADIGVSYLRNGFLGGLGQRIWTLPKGFRFWEPATTARRNCRAPVRGPILPS
jgi:hypothetical protein